jgi:hypothetical protein
LPPEILRRNGRGQAAWGGGAEGWAEAAAPTGHGAEQLGAVSSSLWQPRMEWMADGRGRHTLSERSDEELAVLTAELRSGSEAERMAAAGQLAHTVADLGVGPLVAEMRRPAEGPARAATYGLACGGDGAVPQLGTLLSGRAPEVPAGSASSSVPSQLTFSAF